MQMDPNTFPQVRQLQTELVHVYEDNGRLKQLLNMKYNGMDTEYQLQLIKLVNDFA